jgi:cytochrome b involved in lipid metabolism
MQTKLLLGAVAIVALGVFGIALLQHPTTQSSTPAATADASAVTVGNTTSTATNSSAPAASSGHTLADVAQHNDSTSCWAAINGKVYDLTQWINQHPGGPERILAICGTDATAQFNAQHGGQSRPENELAKFYLAPLSR